MSLIHLNISYKLEIKNRFSALQTLAEEITENIEKIFQEAACKHLPKKKTKKKAWITEETLATIEERKEMKQRFGLTSKEYKEPLQLLNCKQTFKNFLGQYGKLNSLNIDSKSGRFVLAEFAETESAKEILRIKRAKVNGCKMFFHLLCEKRTSKDDEHKNTQTKSRSELMELLSRATDMEDQLRKLIDDQSLTDEDNRIRKEICAHLQKVLSPYFERCKIYQFGSSVNNFGARRCDLDLFIDFQSDEESSVQTKPQVRLPFHKDLASVNVNYGPLTAEQFESFGTYDKVKLISRIICRKYGAFSFVRPVPSKRCPLVKFYHQQSALSCDLSFNNRKALYNSGLLRLYGTNPVVKSVVMAVRYWAKVQELGGNSACTISSYALTWMVLFFLMYRQPQVIPKVWDVMSCVEDVRAIVVDSWKTMDIPLNSQLPLPLQEESPVDLVREFFHFYANEVDWDSTALITSNATFISQESLLDQFPQCQVGFMTMLDPFDLSHNVLQRVNEKSKIRLIAEIKRAAELSHKLPRLSLDTDVKTWGIATLFVPNPDASISPSKKQSKKSKKRKKKGSDETARPSDYVINFSSIRTGHLGCHSIWCDLVKKMLVKILQNVFMADVKQESSCLPCDKENNVEIDDGEEQNASLAEGNRMTTSKTDANVKDGGPPIPWEISLDGSPVSEELKAGCSKTANNTEEFHKLQSPPRAERKSVSLCPSRSSSVHQFSCNDELESKQTSASLYQSNNRNDKSVVKGLKEKVEINSGNESIQPIVSQVKRSSVDACLDKSSPSREMNSDMQMFRDANYSPSQEEDSQMVSSKPASKKVRLLSNDENEEGDRAERGKSFVPDTHHLKTEQADEVKSFDPAVPPEFHKNLVMEVSPERLPSLLQSSTKAQGFISASTYSCTCSIPVWQGRNKLRTSVMKSKKQLQGLALESEVSRKLIQTTNETQNQNGDIVVDNDPERRKKKALLKSLKETDGASEETSHSQAHLSDPDVELSSNKALASPSSPSDRETLQFSCEIIQKCMPQSGNPVVQLRFYPPSQQMSSFKNFFSCAMSMMTRLVAHNLLDNDG